MIASLRGKLIHSDNAVAVIECNGVGFKCFASLKTLSKLPKNGSEVFLYTYLAVKEDGIDLFGFSDNNELECFKLLISVSGVGAKTAISFLSEYTPDQISFYILSGDYKALTHVSGVGTKTAQRIVLELKDKIGKGSITLSEDTVAVSRMENRSNMSEAVAALVALGFSQSEASLAVGKLDPSLPVDELIKNGLKNLSSKV